MSYVVTMKKLEVFEVTFPDGTISEMRQEGSDWNGMRELRDSRGFKIIAMRKDHPNAFDEIFGPMFGNLFRMDDREWVLVAASPEFVSRMKLKGA